MQPVDGPVLDAQETLAKALAAADQAQTEHLLVRFSPSGWGSVSKEQLRAFAVEGNREAKLSSTLTVGKLPYLHPDHPLETALRYVDRWPVVPVVSRADFRKLEGVVSQRGVLERYREFGEG